MKLQIDTIKATLIFENPYSLPEDELERQLEGTGYKHSPSIVVAIGPDGSSAQVLVWKKGNGEIGYDPTRGFLTAQAQDFVGASAVFREMVKIVREMGEEYFAGVTRSEIIMNGRAKGNKYPMIALAEMQQSAFPSGLSEIFGKPVSPFAIRICPKDMINSKEPLRKLPEWFELSVQPMPDNPMYYLISLVYRNPDVDNVTKFVDNLGAKIEKLISLVEKEG